MKKFILGCILLLLGFNIMGQLPNTQIYVFDYEEDEKFKLSNTKLLTYDNKTGYSNQPSFIRDKLYITQSSRAFVKTQTDIFALDLKNKYKSKVTRSRSNEYSPTPCPDGENFSVIRQFDTGVQQLWRLPLDQQDYGDALFPQITNVGYHCWLNDNEVALFLVDEKEGHELVIGDIRTGDVRHVSFNVGRCIKKSPKGNLVYVHKVSDNSWQLKSRNIQTDQTVVLAQTLPQNKDFDILPDGRLICGYEGSLYRLEPEAGNEWVSITRIGHIIGNKEITRIAVNNDKIAIVAKISE